MALAVCLLATPLNPTPTSLAVQHVAELRERASMLDVAGEHEPDGLQPDDAEEHGVEHARQAGEHDEVEAGALNAEVAHDGRRTRRPP